MDPGLALSDSVRAICSGCQPVFKSSSSFNLTDTAATHIVHKNKNIILVPGASFTNVLHYVRSFIIPRSALRLLLMKQEWFQLRSVPPVGRSVGRSVGPLRSVGRSVGRSAPLPPSFRCHRSMLGKQDQYRVVGGSVHFLQRHIHTARMVLGIQPAGAYSHHVLAHRNSCL